MKLLEKYIPKRKKRRKSCASPVLNNCKKREFKKRKRQLHFHFSCLQKFKVFGNNIVNYYFALIWILIFLFICLYYWNTFNIKYINIIRDDNNINQNIAYDSLNNIRWKKIFDINTSDVLSRLNSYQNHITDVKLSFSLPDSIKIRAISSPSIYNTVIHDKSYVLTRNGTAIPQSPDENLKTIELKKDYSKYGFLDYKQILREDYLVKIDEVIQLTKENIIDIQLKNILYYPEIREVHLAMEDDALLIFSLTDQIDEQIKKLAIFNKEHAKITTADLIYMDLRIKNKLFYCQKDTEAQCKKNLKKIYLNK